MLIDGRKIAGEIQTEIKQAIESYSQEITLFRPPCLAVIVVGDHPSSRIYVERKAQACEAVGIRSIKIERPASLSEKELLDEIKKLNEDPLIDGILVQLPLPPQINPSFVLHSINYEKDVDGFHPYNVGKMLIGEKDGFLPCTPLGIITLMQRSGIEATGKHALVIGRSNIVGKPTAALLMQSTPGGNATVTIAHRHTQNLFELCRMADIIVAAIGRPEFITGDMVKEGAVVIDVGTNRVVDSSKKSGYRITGDVQFSSVAPKCSFITPVPGGVGPMTIAMLLQNTLLSYQKKISGV